MTIVYLDTGKKVYWKEYTAEKWNECSAGEFLIFRRELLDGGMKVYREVSLIKVKYTSRIKGMLEHHKWPKYLRSRPMLGDRITPINSESDFYAVVRSVTHEPLDSEYNYKVDLS